MKKTSAIAKATLALALATGGTALYAQDTGAPETAAPGEPAPGEPLPEPAPADPAPLPPADPVDEDGDGIDDVTGEPIEAPADTSGEF